MIGLRPYQTNFLAISTLLFMLLFLFWDYRNRSGLEELTNNDANRSSTTSRSSVSSLYETISSNHGELDEHTLLSEIAGNNIPTVISNDGSPQGAATNEFQVGLASISRVLVVARLQHQHVDWIQEELPDIYTAIYVADDETAALHPPVNKGNEAMVYLTYIIDNYHSLSDVTIFIHNHEISWHNNDLLSSQMSNQLQYLQLDHVVSQG